MKCDGEEDLQYKIFNVNCLIKKGGSGDSSGISGGSTSGGNTNPGNGGG